MKKIIRRVLAELLSFDLLSEVFERTAGWFVDYSRIIRRTIVAERREQSIPELKFLRQRLKNLIVYSGPFRGLCYPKAESAGSALVPKILGTYESELHGVMEFVCNRGYRCVVDVGCAEGYYAIGLALRLSDALVFAFDTDLMAQELCRSMAKVNNVTDRVLIGGNCTSKTLMCLPLQTKSLVICDCEGYELTLFSEEAVNSLRCHDLLIEVHDFVNSGISETLRQRFRGTHRLKVICSVTDRDKASLYQLPITADCSLELKELLFAERRPCIMEWFFLESLDGV